MDSCIGVEQDLDKALVKFNALNEQTNRIIQEMIDHAEHLKSEIVKCKFLCYLPPFCFRMTCATFLDNEYFTTFLFFYY